MEAKLTRHDMPVSGKVSSSIGGRARKRTHLDRGMTRSAAELLELLDSGECGLRRIRVGCRRLLESEDATEHGLGRASRLRERERVSLRSAEGL